MACDSAASNPNGDVLKLSTPKIIKKVDSDNNELLIGVTGSMRGIQLLEYQWTLPERSVCISDKEYIIVDIVNSIKDLFITHCYGIKQEEQELQDDQFMIGYKGEIYLLDTNYQIITTQNDYAAIGAGAPYAFGFMYSERGFGFVDYEKIVSGAVEVACEFCNSCCEPINVFNI